MSTTPEDAARDAMIEEILEDHRPILREEFREEFREELEEEILGEIAEDYIVWVSTEPADIQSQISNVARALKELVTVVQTDNRLPEQEDLLNSIERKQLIAVLEAALIEIKAPYVDRGRFAALTNGVKRVLERSVEKEASEGVQKALKNSANACMKLIGKLAEQTGITDLWL